MSFKTRAKLAELGERKTSLWLFWSVARPLICRQIFGTCLTPGGTTPGSKRRRRPRPQTTAPSCNSTASVDSFAVCIVPALPVPWKLRPGIQSPPSRRAQSELDQLSRFPCSRSPTLVPLGGELYSRVRKRVRRAPPIPGTPSPSGSAANRYGQKMGIRVSPAAGRVNNRRSSMVLGIGWLLTQARRGISMIFSNARPLAAPPRRSGTDSNVDFVEFVTR